MSKRRALRILLGLVVLGALAWYVWSARGQLAMIRDLHGRELIPMIAVPLASLLVNGWIGRDLAAVFGVRLRPLEWYGLAVINSVGNYLPLPQGGALARGAYLKRRHDLPWPAYTATLLVTYVSAVALYGVLGLAALAAFTLARGSTPPALWGVFVALAGSAVLFTPLADRLPIPHRLHQIRFHMRNLRHSGLIARVILLQMALVSLTTTGLWLACHCLPAGREVNWAAALLLGLMILASGIANVTPGNVGVEQAAAEFTARLLHIAPSVGFLASAIFRAVSVATVLLIAPPFLMLLARKDSQAPSQTIAGKS